MMGEEVALVAVELADVRWFGGIDSHLVKGNAVRDGGDQGFTGVLKADESAIKEMIDGRRQ